MSKAPSLEQINDGIAFRYQIYQRNARSYGSVFDIPYSEFKEAVTGPCSLCGLPADAAYTFRLANGMKYRLQGLSLVDRSLGYVSGNVRGTCPGCNKRGK